MATRNPRLAAARRMAASMRAGRKQQPCVRLLLKQPDWRYGMMGVLCAVLAAFAAFVAREKWFAGAAELGREAAPKDHVEGQDRRAVFVARQGQASSGEQLYASHCAVCHGATGDGLGQAARYLFPRPRDFSAGGLPLASTDNGVASLEDVERVLARGMPGTSMRAFDALGTSERRLLAQEVLRLRSEGVRRQITRALLQAGEEPVEIEVREAVERITTPGRPVSLPDRWSAGDHAVARGKGAYRTLGCDKCHGDDGMGAEDQALFDSQGEPNRARDLVHEPFKGGRDRESIYLRIVVGMPGTAHPAAPGLPEDQLKDLVEYVFSLARSPERLLTNHERRVHADVRAYRGNFAR